MAASTSSSSRDWPRQGAQQLSSNGVSVPEGGRRRFRIVACKEAAQIDAPHTIWGGIESLSSSSSSQSSSSKQKLRHDLPGGSGSSTTPETSHQQSSGDIAFVDSSSVSSPSSSELSKDADEDSESLLPQVPCDEYGQQMSIGSIGHENGMCGSPCVFSSREKGCMKGVRCEYCHFPHEKKSRMQPCKGRRIRNRDQKERLMDELDRSPETFDVKTLQLPSSITDHELTQTRLFAALERRREELRLVKTVEAWEQEQARRQSTLGSESATFLKIRL